MPCSITFIAVNWSSTADRRKRLPTPFLPLLKDGKAIPKVIDFGVFKALHQAPQERTTCT